MKNGLIAVVSIVLIVIVALLVIFLTRSGSIKPPITITTISGSTTINTVNTIVTSTLSTISTTSISSNTPNTNVTSNTSYNYIVNGDFSTGTYAGWNVTGKGFGLKPLNITYANSHGCYLGSKWANYNGNFFATTFGCGLSQAPGNITSSPFVVSNSYLNFQIISPQNQDYYIEILQGNKPVITANYNTYNISTGAQASYTFRNVTIPLSQLLSKTVRIRVVGDSLVSENFLAVGSFYVSNTPVFDNGVTTKITYNFT